MVEINSEKDYLEIIEDFKNKLEQNKEYIDELEKEVSDLRRQLLVLNINKACKNC